MYLISELCILKSMKIKYNGHVKSIYLCVSSPKLLNDWLNLVGSLSIKTNFVCINDIEVLWKNVTWNPTSLSKPVHIKKKNLYIRNRIVLTFFLIRCLCTEEFCLYLVWISVLQNWLPLEPVWSSLVIKLNSGSSWKNGKSVLCMTWYRYLTSSISGYILKQSCGQF